MGEVPIAIFNVDATKRPASLNTQDKLLAHLGKTPFRAPVSVFTEVSSKFFAERIAGAQPEGARYAEHEFARYDRTVQIFPTEWSEDGAAVEVSRYGKYMATPLCVEGQDVLLYTVHLSRRNAATRRREFRVLAKSIEAKRPDYNEIIVCGDFNEQCDAVARELAGLDLHAAIRPGDARTAASGAIDNLLASAKVGPVLRWEKSLFTHTPLCVPVIIEN